MAAERKPRDYKREKDNGQMELLSGLQLVRKEREGEVLDILQLAQIFAICCLPYRPTDDHHIVRTARLGDGSSIEVTFTALRQGISIAYGTDRSLLYWLIDRAIQDNTDFVSWDTASDYLRATNQGLGGRNRTLLRERFERIASTSITVVRKSSTLGSDQVNMPLVKRMTLPASIVGEGKAATRDEVAAAGTAFGLRLDPDFVQDFMTHRVPVLRSLVIATNARPQLQDCMFFLIWRSYSAGSPSLIDWDKLREQFWQADSNQSRIRLRFREAIAHIRSTWPELQAESRPKGLWIAPPRGGVQFIPQFRQPKHLAIRAKREVEATENRRFEAALATLPPHAAQQVRQQRAGRNAAENDSVLRQLYPKAGF